MLSAALLGGVIWNRQARGHETADLATNQTLPPVTRLPTSSVTVGIATLLHHGTRRITAEGAASSTTPFSKRSIAIRASPMSRKRSFGSLQRQRLSSRRRPGCAAAETADHSGSVLSTLANVVEMS